MMKFEHGRFLEVFMKAIRDADPERDVEDGAVGQERNRHRANGFGQDADLPAIQFDNGPSR